VERLGPGPTASRDRIFSPVATTDPSPLLNFNHNHKNKSTINNHGSGLPLDYRNDMSGASDIEAQEALAREYNAALEVSW